MLRTHLVSIIAASLGLAACSGKADYPENTFNVDETLTTENVVAGDLDLSSAPLLPAHEYDFKEGDIYGYVAAVSEEDKKKGKVAGDVVMFRYLGFQESVDRLEMVDAAGNVTASFQCARPCIAIKINRFGRLDRIAFNPDSIVGGAFADAQNGKLAVATQPTAEVETTVPEFAGEQSAAEPGPTEPNANTTDPGETVD